MKAPLSSVDTGGGVWRINWSKVGGAEVLDVACMYAGAKLYVVDNVPVDGCPSEAMVLHQSCEYKQHASMVYGIQRLPSHTSGQDVLVTCSFYDQQIHFWCA
jgi:hypothetical protein